MVREYLGKETDRAGRMVDLYKDSETGEIHKVKAWDETGKAICGATKKSGNGVCRGKPMKSGRCRMHGGDKSGAPKGVPQRHRVIAGMYRKAFSPEEIAEAKTHQGDLGEELAITRLQYRCMLQKWKEYGFDPEVEIREKLTYLEACDIKVKAIARLEKQLKDNNTQDLTDGIKKLELEALRGNASSGATQMTDAEIDAEINRIVGIL